MAEKNDDIKNLFLNLGLNPNDYQEIRSAPTANATVSEAPRRWSLLQAAAPKPVTAPAPLPAATLSTVPPASAVAPPGPNTLSAALLAAARDIARVENGQMPAAEAAAPVTAPAPALAVLPSALADAFAQPVHGDGLQSLFQSVKEPQTVTVISQPREEENRRTERPADPAFVPPPVAASLVQRAASLPERAPTLLPEPPSRLLTGDEPETRYAAPPPSRLGPVPVAAPAPVSAPVPTPVVAAKPAAAAAPVAVASGLLRIAVPVAEVGVGHGESLQDVFRRLSGDNRA